VLHTPSLFPLGSKKVKRRPPGNAYGSSAIVPSASLTADGGVEVVGVEQDERSTGLDVLAETETADLAVTLGCLDASVGRRIVGEPPAEGREKCWAASISVTVIST
jgi:hypothetical protein